MSGRVRDPIWRAAIYAAPFAVGAFAVLGAFRVGVVVDTGSVRYVTVLWPALLVLVAVTWGARAVPWLAVLVIATAALGCLEFLRGDWSGTLSPDIRIDPPPPRWGRPFSTARVGHLHLYAYDYDLAYVLPEGTKRPPSASG